MLLNISVTREYLFQMFYIWHPLKLPAFKYEVKVFMIQEKVNF